MSCHLTTRIAGPCANCGAYQASGVHLDETALDAAIRTGAKLPIYCGACCKSCTPAPAVWHGEPTTTGGLQRGLFDAA